MIKNALTLTDQLSALVEESPQTVVLQIKKELAYVTYTYREFFDRAQAIAAYLISEGIQKGDRVAIGLKNVPEWGMIYFGILYAGGIAVPFDWQSKKEDIFYFLNHSESQFFFAQNELSIPQDELFSTCPALKRMMLFDKPLPQSSEKAKYLSDILDDHLSKASSASINISLGPDDTASILYTSGTTGQPKGVMLTHRNFCSNLLAIYQLGYLTKRDNILSILPLHHSFPFTITLLTPLFSKNRITYLASVSSADLLQCMQEAGITILVGVPQLYYLFQKNIAEQLQKLPSLLRLTLYVLTGITYQFRKVTRINLTKWLLWKIHKNFGARFRYMVCGGAKFDPVAKRFLIRLGFSLIEGYGLTETSPGVAFNASINKDLDSVGTAIPGVKIKIDRPDSNSVGEVLISGPNVMKGYYHMPLETNAAISDGWFHSGDLGYINKSGKLCLMGRANELIVLSSGKNISPEEVEAHYLKSPFFKELCVLAVSHHSDEKLMAVVVPNMHYLQEHRATNILGSIRFAIENMSKELPPYKHIMGFVLAKSELPRTRLGKLKRFEIRDKYWQALTRPEDNTTYDDSDYSEADQIILASPLFQKMEAIIHQQKSFEKPIRLDDHLEIDLGFDSLSRVELLSKLEASFHVHFQPLVIEKVFIIRDLLTAVETASKQQDNGFMAPPKTWQELLNEAVNPEFLKKIDLSPNRYRNLSLKGIYLFLNGLFRIFWKIKTVGLENIPKAEPCIICANHVSYLDAPALGSSLPFPILKHTYFIGFAGYFENSMLKYATKLCKVVPINAGTRLIDALQVSAHILKKGHSICIFPEGERSIDGTVKTFKKGTGILVKELNMPVVPVYIDGTYEAWSRTDRYPKCHPVKITFGKPCSATELIALGKTLNAHDDYEAITLGIREKISVLAGSSNTRFARGDEH